VSDPPGLWVPLLQRLTSEVPTWYVWKNADSALLGEGDVDSAAPRREWPRLVAEFRAWARETHLRAVVVCRHAPDSLIVVGCTASRPTRLLQLDVYDRLARVAPAERLLAASELDERGFRRLRPGAEGLLLFLVRARRGGRPPLVLEDVDTARRLLAEDPDGAELASRLLGAMGASAFAGAHALLRGTWNRRAMLMLEPAYAMHALGDVRRRAAWLRFVVGRGRRCPVLRSLAHGRTVAEDLDAWLAEVERRGDAVYEHEPFSDGERRARDRARRGQRHPQ